ncbi:hypothetical protein DFJ43DRAFT_1041462 [Lentinula guzmanii]|uniref:Uncharacterized protein n=1 Tax=Lentinula guzmanii TaxID=2804957 RepID=A0AA38JEF9_9AGAR|nr:hypothetical protein DFJ43DRAFT_1041462 [Lentinula guzmanii]
MTTRSTTSTGKDATSAQPKLNFQTKMTPHQRPTSPTLTESENDEVQALIEKAIAWKLMSKGDSYTSYATILPNKILRLAISAKETGRTKPSLNEILDKIVLMAKILQEWSWKERPDEWRKEMMENMEEELTTRTNNISLTVDGIAREAQETWKKLEEMTGKATRSRTDKLRQTKKTEEP